MKGLATRFQNIYCAYTGLAGLEPAKALTQPVRRNGQVDVGLGIVPAVASDGGHDLVFRHIRQGTDGKMEVVYTHPTKKALTREGRPIRGRMLVAPLEKARRTV